MCSAALVWLGAGGLLAALVVSVHMVWSEAHG